MPTICSSDRNEPNRAVSPVIGVVLMVAITIILAAVIGTFVLGLSPDAHQTAIATISIDGDAGDGNITLVHEGGEALDLAEHTVVVDGSSTDGNASMTETLEPGERKLVTELDAADETIVTLRNDDAGDVVAEATVEIA